MDKEPADPPTQEQLLDLTDPVNGLLFSRKSGERLEAPVRGTLIRGLVTLGEVEIEETKVKSAVKAVKRPTLHIALTSNLNRYIQVYVDDIESWVAAPDGVGKIIRVREDAQLRYVVAYRATGDEIGDLLSGPIAERHRPGDPDDGDPPPKSPRPCVGPSL